MTKTYTNKKIHFLIFFFLVFQSLILSLNSINSLANKSDSIEYGGTFIESSIADAQLFNPIISTDYFSKKIEDLIFDSLITIDKDGNIIPQLAVEWIISSDKLDITFNLRNDVFWHDGEQFTAADVIFTLDRIFDLETDSLLSKRFDYLESYDRLDEFTVIFYLLEIRGSILCDLILNIIPEHAFLFHNGTDGIPHTQDDCRDENNLYTFNDDIRNRDPIGTDSLMFKEWVIDREIILIRNSIDNGGPSYWNGHNTYLDKYILKITPLYELIEALHSGSVHMIDLRYFLNEDIESLIVNDSINVFTSLDFTSDNIVFQCDPEKGDLNGETIRDFSSDPNIFAGFEWMTEDNPEITGYLVRQALNYAIDKETLIEETYPYGYRNKGPLFLAQTEWYNEKVNPYDYNLTKANELLFLAGYGENAEDPLRETLNFSIIYNQGNIRRQKICEFCKEHWLKLGIDIEIRILEWVIWWYGSPYETRNFDSICSSCIGSGFYPDLKSMWSSQNIMPGGMPNEVDIDNNWIWSGSPVSGGLNYMSYWNPEVDTLLDQVESENEESIAKQLYNDIQEKIVDDSPYIWLLSHVNQVAINSSFSGFVENSPYGIWPEPSGFRNIFLYKTEDTTSKASYTNFLTLLLSLMAATIGKIVIKRNRRYF